MDMNGNPVWHAGGKRAPSLPKRSGPPAGIRHRRAINVVPLRATGGVHRDAESLVKGIFQPSGAPNGTEWHECPRESIQGYRRAR